MTERTLQQALEHADNARSAVAYYPREFRSSDPIATTAGDLVLLADEVHRLQKEVDGLKSGAFNAGIVMNLCGDVTHCNTCESAKDFH